jgi:hypothetical protein
VPDDAARAHFDTDDTLADIRTVLGKAEVYGPIRLDEVEAMVAQVAPEPK